MWSVIRRIALALLVILIAFLGYAGLSIHNAMNESPGEPFQVVAATWMRDHNMGGLVARLEDFYYAHINTPAVGGKPTVSASFGADGGGQLTTTEPSTSPPAAPTPASSSTPTPSASGSASGGSSSVAPTPAPDFSFIPQPTASPLPGQATHLQPPADLVSPVSAPEPLEGVWQPVGNRVDGQHAVYVTRIRTDDVHTSYYATAMWLDTSLLSSMFVPGYEEPKGGPNPFNGALPESLWPDLMANVNGAFRLEDTRGGYWYDGQLVQPLVRGRATIVFYRDGGVRIGRWGRDLSLTPDMLAVRQNLDLIVDHGQSQVDGTRYSVTWGATTDKTSLAWRAGIGQRPDGSLVYVIGQALTAQSLADTLVAAGVRRAMVLDMNEYWSAGFYFNHRPGGVLVCHKLDPDISGPCDRYLHPYKRDSFQFLAALPISRRQSSP